MSRHLNREILVKGEDEHKPRNLILLNKYKPASESRIKCMALMPIAKAAQLYGLEDVSRPAKRIIDRTENFKKHHPILGRASEVVSWAAIGFSMAMAGAYLSQKMRGIGSTLSDILGYTVACAHPSAIAISLRKLFKVKSSEAGISRYLEASVVGYTPAAPVFFATLGAITHISSTVGVGRGIIAALTASIATFCAWSAAFSAWWVHVVRKERGEGFLHNACEFVRGFASARKLGKAEQAENGAFHQAGEIVGTSFIVWAVPWYAVRTCVAAFAGSKGLDPASFTKLLVSVMAGLEGLDVLLSGLETTIIEKILKRGRADKPEPKNEEKLAA